MATRNSVLVKGPAVVTVSPNDKGFSSSRCAPWTRNLGPITTSPTAPFSDGTFIVGTDIPPGTWRSDTGSGCYWERLSGFGGTFPEIIANDNPKGSAVVQIDEFFGAQPPGTPPSSPVPLALPVVPTLDVPAAAPALALATVTR